VSKSNQLNPICSNKIRKRRPALIAFYSGRWRRASMRSMRRRTYCHVSNISRY